MPTFRIQHITTYDYDRLVHESMNEIKIFPIISADQEVLEQELIITGNPEVNYFYDYWENKTGSFNLFPLHKELIIDSRLVVRTTQPSDFSINFVSTIDEIWNEINGNLKLVELARPDFILDQVRIRDIIQKTHSPDDSVAITIKNCCEYIFSNFSYIKGITTFDTTVDEILEKNAGVCQDFAHVMLQVLRTLNIPSRYVSGYICPNKAGLRGEGATHAWLEAWVPRHGWAGIDPTNNVWVTNTHVKLATGRSFADCSPVKGSFRGDANQQLTVFVSVDYEDGKIFKDVNAVDFRKENSTPESPRFSPSAQQ